MICLFEYNRLIYLFICLVLECKKNIYIYMKNTWTKVPYVFCGGFVWKYILCLHGNDLPNTYEHILCHISNLTLAKPLFFHL